MKQNKWIVDAIVFIALLFVFLPDLTGFALHEWIGIAIAGVLLVHFLQHWNWVISTSQRISNLKGKVLSRYLVNGGLALGFTTITVTGLVISSLLMLPLDNYEAWRLVHVSSSYITVTLLILKFVMHWDMIAKVLKNVFGVDKATMNLDEQNRRKFLRGAGVTALAGLIAIAEFKEWKNKTTDFSVTTDTDIAEDLEPVVEVVPTMVPTDSVVVESGENLEQATLIEEEQEPTESTNVEIAEEAVVEPTETEEPVIVPTETEAVTTTGVVKCRKGCSYPGRCGRYVDDNQNQKCDLGEPIW